MVQQRRNTFKMVIVDGVRYRPEDAPKSKTSSEVRNKARAPERTATSPGTKSSKKDA